MKSPCCNVASCSVLDNFSCRSLNLQFETDRKNKDMIMGLRCVLIGTLSILLWSCGGGGSTEPDSNGVQQDESDLAGNTTNDGDATDPNNDTDGIGGGDGGDSDSVVPGGTDEGSPDNDDTNASDPGAGIPETSGSLQLIAAERGPAPGIAGQTLGDINEVAVVTSGAMAFTAEYQQRLDGVWHGTVQQPALLFKQGDAIGGDISLPFQDVQQMQLANDGSLGLIVSSDTSQQFNTVDDTAFVISNNGSVEVVVQSGQQLTGELRQEYTVGAVVSMRHSNGGSMIQVSSQDRTLKNLILVYQNGSLEQLAEVSSFTFQGIGFQLPNGCRFVINDRIRTDSQVSLNYSIADSGALVFIADLFNSESNQSCDGSALVRRVGNQYEILATTDQAVPGAPGSSIVSLDMHSVRADGSVVVLAQANTATGEFGGADSWSWWLFPATGEPGLIALAGEEFEIGQSTSVLPGFFGFSRWPGSRLATNGSQVALRLDNVPVPDPAVQDLTADIMFAGPVRGNQPHGELLAPGMAALRAAVVSGSANFPAFPDGSYFSQISDPVAGRNNTWIFTGNLVDASVGGEGKSGIWRTDPESPPVQLFTEGETVLVSGLEREITSVFSNFINRLRGAAPLFELADGALVFLGSIEGGSEALVRTVPSE